MARAGCFSSTRLLAMLFLAIREAVCQGEQINEENRELKLALIVCVLVIALLIGIILVLISKLIRRNVQKANLVYCGASRCFSWKQKRTVPVVAPLDKLETGTPPELKYATRIEITPLPRTEQRRRSESCSSELPPGYRVMAEMIRRQQTIHSGHESPCYAVQKY